jgi:hypothetical protein
MSRLVAFLVLLGVALTIGAAPALAAVPAPEGYTAPGGAIQTNISDGGGSNEPSAQATRTTSGTTAGVQLPFTGLDVGLVLGTGALLLGAGLTMSRLTRSAASRQS